MNYWLIKRLSRKEVIMTDDSIIPISDTKRKEALNKYMELSKKYV
mgnify:CR=1 FL=1